MGKYLPSHPRVDVVGEAIIIPLFWSHCKNERTRQDIDRASTYGPEGTLWHLICCIYACMRVRSAYESCTHRRLSYTWLTTSSDFKYTGVENESTSFKHTIFAGCKNQRNFVATWRACSCQLSGIRPYTYREVRCIGIYRARNSLDVVVIEEYTSS